jgi:hypothetical protein
MAQRLLLWGLPAPQGVIVFPLAAGAPRFSARRLALETPPETSRAGSRGGAAFRGARESPQDTSKPCHPKGEIREEATTGNSRQEVSTAGPSVSTGRACGPMFRVVSPSGANCQVSRGANPRLPQRVLLLALLEPVAWTWLQQECHYSRTAGAVGPGQRRGDRQRLPFQLFGGLGQGVVTFIPAFVLLCGVLVLDAALALIPDSLFS